jgi:hypothetical protein
MGFSPLEALAGPLCRTLRLCRPFPGALAFLVDGGARSIFSGFIKGYGHPHGIPFLLKFHGISSCAYLPFSLFNIHAKQEIQPILLI